MKNNGSASRDEDPFIDPTFSARLNELHELDDALYAANYKYQEAQTQKEREAHCEEFASAAHELQMVAVDMLAHLLHMREGITPAHSGHVIPLRRRGKPRASRGRFIKRMD